MATTSKVRGKKGTYGLTAQSNLSDNHLYVGKTDSGNYYRSRMYFSSLIALDETKNGPIIITNMYLYVRRNRSSSTNNTLRFGCSSSSDWDATLDAYVDVTLTADTEKYQKFDISNLIGKVREYKSGWQLHIKSTGAEARLYGTGTTSGKYPYLEFTWQPETATLSGDQNNATLGSTTVTFTVNSLLENAKRMLTYTLGDLTGNITDSPSENTTFTWIPPLALATEITEDSVAIVEIHMTTYDSSGNEYNSEVYYQTVTIPDSMKPTVKINAQYKNQFIYNGKGYTLAGYTRVAFSPSIDMTNEYGASIKSVTITTTDGQTFSWNEFVEDDSNSDVFRCETVTTNVLPSVEWSASMVVVDSRGREATSSLQSVTPTAYTPPRITNFKVERCEPFYDSNEEVSGVTVSDVGSMLCVTLSAVCSSFMIDGKDINVLSWDIVGEKEDGSLIRPTADGLKISLPLDKDFGVFPVYTKQGTNEAYTIEASDSYVFTVTVTDTIGGTAVQYDVVPPGHASFSISADKYGVAVGKVASGRQNNPKFEVAEDYTTHFGGDAYDKYNNLILGSSIIKNIDLAASDDMKAYTTATTKTFSLRSNSDDDNGDGYADYNAAGLYLITVSVTWNKSLSANSGKRIYVGVKVGNTYYLDYNMMSSDSIQPSFCGTVVVPLISGQRIELIMEQHTGVDLNLWSGRCTVTKIG